MSKKYYLCVAISIAVLFPLGAKAAQWETVLNCDDQAAVIEANISERRQVRIIIRNQGIVQYFAKSGVGSSPGALFTGSEIVREGFNPIGVYSGHDVQHFSSSRPSSYSNTEYSYIWREGSGIKIKVEDQHNGCPPECQESPLSMHCESLCVGAQVGNKYDLANWYFRNCQ